MQENLHSDDSTSDEKEFDLNDFFSLEKMLERKREFLKGYGSFVDERGREMSSIRDRCGMPETGSFYYPACGSDYSPSLAFPGWEVTYLDPVLDPKDFEGKTGKADFLKGDLTRPPFGDDVLFDAAALISPGHHFEPAQAILPVVKHLKTGGIFICDNYHGTAGYVSKNMSESFEKIDLGNKGELYAFRKKE